MPFSTNERVGRGVFILIERRGILKEIIKLPKENLQGIRFFIEGLSFTVVAGYYNEWEERQLSYLVQATKGSRMSTKDICKWCINHNIHYQILYPINKMQILKDPIRFISYLKLKKKIKMLWLTQKLLDYLILYKNPPNQIIRGIFY